MQLFSFENNIVVHVDVCSFYIYDFRERVSRNPQNNMVPDFNKIFRWDETKK